MERITLIILPPVIIASLYLLTLGHRTDYVGHFLAGYAATLLILASFLDLLANRPRPVSTGSVVLLIVAGCIAIGAIMEATTFRLAKFDEIDFFNQSLGAVVAGLATLATTGETPGPERPVLITLVSGFLFLAAGFYLAFY